MCQLSGISKAGTKQNSTRIVDYCFFNTDLSSECIAKSRICGFERQDFFVSFCHNVFSVFLSHGSFCRVCGVIRPCNQEYSHKGQ